MIRLGHPTVAGREDFLRSVREILDGGSFTRGRHVKAFEDALAERFGTEHCVAVSSGTAALHLSILALNIGAGDRVVAPAFTFPATTNVVELVGADTNFVDGNLATLSSSSSQLLGGIDDDTTAVIAVHPFGAPADVVGLRDALPPSVTLIEDAAAALGAELSGSACGSLGDLACFSFHPRKILTSGEGGAIVTPHAGLADELRALRNHGLISVDGKPQWGAQPGLNYRLAELPAALGLAQIGHLDKTIEQRIELRQALIDSLESIENFVIQSVLPGSRCAWTAFVCRVEGQEGPELCARMRERGVEATVAAFAVHELPYYRAKYRLDPTSLPNASLLGREAIVLPFHENVGPDEIKSIRHALLDALEA